MLTREDWHAAAALVEDEMLSDDDWALQVRVWNLALLHAAHILRRQGAQLPWAEAPAKSES